MNAKLENSVFLVEATGYEMHDLWRRFSPESETATHPVKSWESISEGFGYIVGYIKKRPIVVSLRWAKIDGQYVTFYEGTSQLVDYKMIEDWLHQHFSKTYRGNLWAQIDASNFHLCLSEIQRINKNP